MYHPIRAVTITAATAEKIRVNVFEILKQNNSSAIENITILSPNIRGRKSARSFYMTGDLRPHQQCPWKTENNSHGFQTEESVHILVEVS
jgi:hypothetical protein